MIQRCVEFIFVIVVPEQHDWSVTDVTNVFIISELLYKRRRDIKEQSDEVSCVMS